MYKIILVVKAFFKGDQDESFIFGKPIPEINPAMSIFFFGQYVITKNVFYFTFYQLFY